MKRYAKQEQNPMKRLYAEITWRKLATYEREVCGRFTHCLTCSDEERVLLQTRSRVERVSVIPNGVDIDAHVFRTTIHMKHVRGGQFDAA